MGVAEDLGADGGADLHVFDLIQGDLDPSVGGKKPVDLSVQTVFGDKDQCADSGDQSRGKTQKGDNPEAESQKADQASDAGVIVREQIQKTHAAGNDQIRQYRHQRGAKVKEDRIIFSVRFFDRFKSHGDHCPPEVAGVRI